MLMRKSTFKALQQKQADTMEIVERQGNVIVGLRSTLSLREDDLRRTRERLRKALEDKSGEPEECRYDSETDTRHVAWLCDRNQCSIPPVMDRGQAIYWSYSWQAEEEETRKELAEGGGKTFSNSKEAIYWLLSDDA